MTRGIFSGRLLGLLDVFGVANAAAAARNSNHQPDPRDMKRLGIDADRFREINRF